MRRIEWYEREHYGITFRYVLDPEMREAVAALTRRKSLTTQDCAALERMGFEMVQIPAPSRAAIAMLAATRNAERAQ